MENKKIQEIDLKLPKNAKLFYIPEKDIYVLRHYETNILVLNEKEIIYRLPKEDMSLTSYNAIRSVYALFKIDHNLTYTNKNKYTEEARYVFNYHTRESIKELYGRYNKAKWSQIAEEIYNNIGEISK